MMAGDVLPEPDAERFHLGDLAFQLDTDTPFFGSIETDGTKKIPPLFSRQHDEADETSER